MFMQSQKLEKHFQCRVTYYFQKSKNHSRCYEHCEEKTNVKKTTMEVEFDHKEIKGRRPHEERRGNKNKMRNKEEKKRDLSDRMQLDEPLVFKVPIFCPSSDRGVP